MKNVRTLFFFQLKINRKSITVWSVILFGIMAMYMAFFSTMQEMAQVKFDMLPKEYLQLMGVNEISQMNNYVTFFGMIFNILVIIISIYAVTLGINLILKEEKNKTIEFLYALSVTRKEIYVSKILIALFSVLMVVFASSLAGIILGFIVGDETFRLEEMFSIIKMTGTVPFFFVAFGLFLSAASSKYTNTGVGCGIVMLTYMLGYLGNILDDRAEFLKYISPFELLSPANAVERTFKTYAAFGAVAGLTVLFLVFSAFMYSRRDYNL